VKPEGKRTLGRTGRKLGDKIKMWLKEMVRGRGSRNFRSGQKTVESYVACRAIEIIQF
jgi:hypothetical protein